MTDNLDDFMEFDATMGSDLAKCAKYGHGIASSLILDDEIECQKCGYVISKTNV